jgi:hypothetical protein
MELTGEQRKLRDHYFQVMVDAIMPLKSAPDPELALEMLIEAAAMLKQHLEQELDELRLEQVE